ncbi:hypothetical protein Rhopal_004667-T1 [Rhodotorula paludigena]|uniref:Alpha/beta hydrolase fold-3 domain-containing protein n=1 Tax=Rhodotorula paludigena TaxID=86838 RepID=A0AAV5GMC5_9BASI|nr:hypothetical protein Rhopal_004667-T1 [Rhodotorula paludigena]
MDLLPLNTFTLALSAISTISKTFLLHYTKRKTITDQTKARESLLYDEAFSVMKKFFAVGSMHTVEEMQAFGNNFVPAPFWVRVIRVTVPLSTRLEAGKYIIAGLGEGDIERIVGGREWWQRTNHPEGGVCGEWISLKRDWEGLEAEARAQKKGAGKGKGDKTAGDPGREEELEERLKRLKEEGRKDARRRRAEGRAARSRATSFGSASASASDTEADAERRYQRHAAEAQHEVHGGETYNDAASAFHHEDESYTSELDDMPVVLAIHGGAHFFGSTNTHRYWYWRLARKTGGRVFSIDYRLSPQFPFPCALHDCLAAYLYLIKPPPEAKHRAVDPSRLTICGDSAGGNLALALLCLLRDTGLPQPAGAMLISPWGDLTHSFPSILENTETDIPPPYGFGIFKPSTLWPPPPKEFRKRAEQSTSLAGLKDAARRYQNSSSGSQSREASSASSDSHQHKHRFGSLATHRKAHELADAVQQLPDDKPQAAEQHDTAGAGAASHERKGEDEQHKAEVAEVITVKVDGEEVKLVDQIQLYATNEQLIYPFVSPIWQPSLGGLPPLYIVAGDKEVLRDEIVFIAHRAAHPDRYPVREGILKQNPERTARSKEYPPTKVHFQIYDEVCHDLPLFSFTTPAKYCYRAMASFARWVTTPAGETPDTVTPDGMRLPVERDPNHPDATTLQTPQTSAPTSRAPSVSGKKRSKDEKRSDPPPLPVRDLEKTIYSSTQPFNRPDYVDGMIRERVSITGVVRPMEPESEMSMLHLDPEDLGLIKENAVKRYLAGKAILERKFRRTYAKVQKTRERHLKKSMQEEAMRITKRVDELKKQQEQEQRHGSGSSGGRPDPSKLDPNKPPKVTNSPEPLDIEQTSGASIGLEGIWELHGEHPPPSSLAGRKDTAEARKLAKVLDEHYSRMHALALWSEVHDIVRPPRHGSADIEPAAGHVNAPEPSASVQLGTSSRP